MFALLAIIGTFLYGTLVGWITHWMIHQRWAGRFYRSHMTHHVTLYPPGNLFSEKYRDPGGDNTVFVFAPVLVVAFAFWSLLMWAIGASGVLLVGLVIEALIVGVLHDLMHTWFHLWNTFLNRFLWFRALRLVHHVHHKNMQRNFGIFWFGWDRVFRTYRGVR